MNSTDRLRIAVAVDLKEELCRLIEEADPRFEVIRDHSLYRPMRGAADWSGDSQFVRTDEQQSAFDAMVDSADALFGIPDVDPVALARTVRANPRLKWVHATAAGGGSQVEAAQLGDAALDKISFTTSAGVHSDQLAEFALFGVLAGAKDMPRLQAAQQEKRWQSRWQMRKLSDMTVLVVGLGGIGRAVARTFSSLGAHVLGTTRSADYVDGVNELIPIDEIGSAVGRADAIVAALPGTSQTVNLLGQEIFAGIKPGAIVCNVGRGTVIDENALIESLTDGRVSFAALDVFSVEPLPLDSPLWEMPNVLVSPHTAALHAAEERRIAELFAENGRRLLDNEPLNNVVDTVEFY